MKDHIRDERATREKYKLVGNGLELEDRNDTRTLCVAWCGEDASGAFFFRSIDDVAVQAKLGLTPTCRPADPPISVCWDCLDAVVTVLQIAAKRAS